MRIFAFLTFFLVAAAAADAAQVKLEHATDGTPYIAVEGELLSGDEKAFNNLAIPLDRTVVFFSSPGGDLVAGLSIGRTISIKGFATVVMPNDVCVSACALAWIAGTPRVMARNSAVGFHAAYKLENGQTQESGVANALVGAYLTQLGFNQATIIYATMQPPNGMEFLTPEMAAKIGLQVSFTDEKGAFGDPPGEAAPRPQEPESEISSAPETTQDGAASHASTPQISSPQWVELAHSDLPGSDFKGMPIKALSTGQCRAVCQSTPNCSAYTFNAQHKACFLKWGASVALQFTGAESGYLTTNTVSRVGKNYAVDPGFRTAQGTEIAAKPISLTPSSSLAECQDNCIGNLMCWGFTYYPTGTCAQFGTTKPTRRNAGAFSGSRFPGN